MFFTLQVFHISYELGAVAFTLKQLFKRCGLIACSSPKKKHLFSIHFTVSNDSEDVIYSVMRKKMAVIFGFLDFYELEQH